jgi:hypothetical protein
MQGMSDPLSEQAGRSLFQPHYGRIAECLSMAWQSWEAIRKSKDGQDLGKRTRASAVWDKITRRAETVFGDLPGVTVRYRHSLVVLDFGQAMMRFNLLRLRRDGRLRRGGIATGQQRLFDGQGQLNGDEQLTLWPPVPMVIAGYILDELETSIQRMVLVLQLHGETIWEIEIPPAGEVPAALPSAGDQPRPATPRSIRPIPMEGEEAQ